MKAIYLIENVIGEQREEVFQKLAKKWCSRREESLVDLDSDLAQVVIGMRRSGKSVLCYNVLKKSGKSFAYVNFDDERLSDLQAEDLDNLLQVLYSTYGKFEVLFLDELQNIDSWYLFVNRLLRKGIKVLITGSNAKLLSSDLATHLTGRCHKIELLPFSFNAFCEFAGTDILTRTTESAAKRRETFKLFLKQGGLPELFKEKNFRSYISDLLDGILKRDIQTRFRLNHLSDFLRLTNCLLDIVPTEFSACNFQKSLSIKSVNTIKNYIAYLRGAYVVLPLHKFSFKTKIRMTGEKIYPSDIAFMNGRENAFVGENLGWRLETLVFLELLRRARMQGQDLYYYSERSYEIDFVVCENRKVQSLFQVSYNLANEKTRSREINALLKASEKLNCEDLWLVIDGFNEDVEINGKLVKIRSASEWLINRAGTETFKS